MWNAKLTSLVRRFSILAIFTTIGFLASFTCLVFIALIHNNNRDINWDVYIQEPNITTKEQKRPLHVDPSQEFDVPPDTTTLPTSAESNTSSYHSPFTDRRPNVLFLMTDDMRAQLGSYQDYKSPLAKPRMVTPHLDKLASRSLLLRRAYVQYSLCGPSRTSILTSRRPDTTRIFDNRNYWRDFGGNFTTIPQYFKDNGYFTVGIGKIFHRDVSSNENDPLSWSVPYIMPKHSEGSYMQGEAGWKAVSKHQREQVELMDTVSVQRAKSVLKTLAPKAKTGEKPFFLALGFKKPHSSYVCPKEFFSLYPLESEEQFLADISWQTISFKKTRNLQNVSITTDGHAKLSHEALRQLRRAYFACISYVDSLVGEILGYLDELDLSKSTIVTFISDHGYHFGENALYGKQSLYETGTHVPMMIRIPGRTDRGIISDSVVESIDLFPTLADAAGLPAVPACPLRSANVDLCTQGKTLTPLLGLPTQTIKSRAFSQIAATLGYMRYTMRTSRFRYTEWTRVKRDTTPKGIYKVDAMNLVGFPTELYDYMNDPEETENVSKDPRYLKIKEKLSRELQAFIPTM